MANKFAVINPHRCESGQLASPSNYAKFDTLIGCFRVHKREMESRGEKFADIPSAGSNY